MLDLFNQAVKKDEEAGELKKRTQEAKKWWDNYVRGFRRYLDLWAYNGHDARVISIIELRRRARQLVAVEGNADIQKVLKEIGVLGLWPTR